MDDVDRFDQDELEAIEWALDRAWHEAEIIRSTQRPIRTLLIPGRDPPRIIAESIYSAVALREFARLDDGDDGRFWMTREFLEVEAPQLLEAWDRDERRLYLTASAGIDGACYIDLVTSDRDLAERFARKARGAWAIGAKSGAMGRTRAEQLADPAQLCLRSALKAWEALDDSVIAPRVLHGAEALLTGPPSLVEAKRRLRFGEVGPSDLVDA